MARVEMRWFLIFPLIACFAIGAAAQDANQGASQQDAEKASDRFRQTQRGRAKELFGTSRRQADESPGFGLADSPQPRSGRERIGVLPEA